MLRVRPVQVFQHLCGPLVWSIMASARESNHDGPVASIDMRNYQRFPDMPELFAVDASRRVVTVKNPPKRCSADRTCLKSGDLLSRPVLEIIIRHALSSFQGDRAALNR